MPFVLRRSLRLLPAILAFGASMACRSLPPEERPSARALPAPSQSATARGHAVLDPAPPRDSAETQRAVKAGTLAMDPVVVVSAPATLRHINSRGVDLLSPLVGTPAPN